MKNFLKENWFKIAIVLILFIITIAFVYYFFILIPKQEAIKLEYQKQQQIFAEEKLAKAQEAKRLIDQQEAEAKAEQDKQLADQKSAEEKATQAKQSAANKAATAKQEHINNCLHVANSIHVEKVTEYGYSEAEQKAYENLRAVCLNGGS